MMSTGDSPQGASGELAERYEALVDEAGRRGLTQFPEWPHGSLALAEWPGAPEDLVDLAAQSGAALIYIVASVFDRASLEQIEAELAESVDRDPGDAEALDDARRRLGEVCRLDCGFTHGGVMHACSVEADWLSALERRVEIEYLAETASVEIERQLHVELASELWDDIDELATELSEEREFLAAPNDDARRAVAANHPVVGRALELRHDGEVEAKRAYSAALEVLRVATDRVRKEVRPRLEREFEERLDSVATNLARSKEFRGATTKTERRRLAAGLVESDLGYHVAGLADQLEAEARTLADGGV